MGAGVLVELFELVVVGECAFGDAFAVGDAGEAETRLQVLVVLPAGTKLYLGVEGTLAAQTPAALLLGYDFGADEVFLSLGELLDLPAFAFVVVFVHFVVRFVAEGLEGEELGMVLDISELLERSPVLVVVIFKDEGLFALALLRGGRATSRTKLAIFSFSLSWAFSLKSGWGGGYLSA